MTSYTLFGNSGGGTVIADASWYTFGVQFSVSAPMPLAAMHWYSPPGAAELPNVIGLFLVSSQAELAKQFVTWSGAAGSGWVRATFASPPSLSASTAYKAVVSKQAGGGGVNWYSATSGYWTSSGVTNGPLSAPLSSGADGGQNTFYVGGTDGYPASSFGDSNYWLDVEVGTSPVTVSGPLAVSIV